MFEVIVGNICSLGAMLSDMVSGTKKDRKAILLAQSVSQIFYIISSIVLKGYSATVQNVVTLTRNILIFFGIDNKVSRYIFIIIPVVLGIYFNNRGIIGYLPVIANLEYSISVYIFKNNPAKIKICFAINCMMFVIFNFYILNFVAAIGSIVVSFTVLFNVYKENKQK